MAYNIKFKKTEIGLIPEDWKTVKIGDVCNVTSSKRIFFKEYVKIGIPFYRSKEIILKANDQEIINKLFIPERTYKLFKNKYGVPQEGEILLTSVGTLGVPYIVKLSDKFYFKDGNLTWFKEFKSVIDSKFLYYWLKSTVAKKQIDIITIGSTQQALTIDALKGMHLGLMPISEQRIIFKILSNLDEKIKINIKINNYLEQISQLLFKHWFIYFEFPNEQGQPYKSSGGEFTDSELGQIPKGWKVGSLDEVTCKFATGLNPRKNFVLGKGHNYYVTIKNMGNNQICLDDKCDKVTDEAIIKINKRSNLEKGDLLFSGIGTIGRVYILDTTPKNWNISESVFTIRANELLSSEILYMILLGDDLQGYASQLASGSVQKGIRMADLKKYKMLIPTKNVVDSISSILRVLIMKIKYNQAQNKILTNIRDTLLPKLITGKIRVNLEDIKES